MGRKIDISLTDHITIVDRGEGLKRKREREKRGRNESLGTKIKLNTVENVGNRKNNGNCWKLGDGNNSRNR